ncbi:RNA methyltransferase [Suhomyces tanzawaensis NRRL Y-17324]|uniref:RNA methyltransferase n=1 Tax=Suhomyces tanzawaensis NRRL Y-17324 TaxID=984487 RepID=A0A1E4SK88_9ASCO|nr:RNA methyltransferase [Suhomyces tanzawaensis NRRL Y-17324]ODV79921.1 RNA methyltransferase [Suhomyces tanzawaensis NRRL Y-17324]
MKAATRNLVRTAVRRLGSSLSNLIYVTRRKSLTDNLSVISSQEQPRARSNQKVLRDLKKVKKKTKRDTSDNTSKENLNFLEVQEAIEVFNAKNSLNIDINQVSNPSEIIDTFLFSKKRPEIIIPNLEIVYQTFEGNGIGIIPKSMYITPFTESEEHIFNKFTVVQVPKTVVGDKVNVKLALHTRYYAEGVLQEVIFSKKSVRNNDLIVCNKFDECNGCQLQMMTYDDQLKFKESVIKKAYKFFYPELLNQSIGSVYGSPMEYSYRNKITPHFKYPRVRRNHDDVIDLDEPTITDIKIGMQHINPTKGMVDIDHCEIATPIINEQLLKKRLEIQNSLENIPAHKQGRQQTLFLRESLVIDNNTGNHSRTCISESKNKVITEKVEDFVFQFEPSGFFQNNNHILPLVLDYMRYHIGDYSYKYLIDTYCGSGFFGISLSKDIAKEGKIFGIELAELSIKYATHNAKLNGLKVPEQIQFIEGNSESLFKNDEFLRSGITGDESIVIMDPSRKGSNISFMKQLLEFKPKLIIYVSCNAFTQARDLGDFFELQGTNNEYKVRDLVGFDFFPQTKHVETVAVIERIG